MPVLSKFALSDIHQLRLPGLAYEILYGHEIEIEQMGIDNVILIA